MLVHDGSPINVALKMGDAHLSIRAVNRDGAEFGAFMEGVGGSVLAQGYGDDIFTALNRCVWAYIEAKRSEPVARRLPA